MPWKDLRSYKRKLFLCNRRKHKQHFKLLFLQNKLTLYHINGNIFLWKTKFSSHKQHSFVSLFTRNLKRIHTDLLCLKSNDTQTFQCSSCKKPFFQCVCYWCNLLRWMCFSYFDNWTIFSVKSIVTLKFSSTAMFLLSLKQAFWKKSVFYMISATSSAILILKFQKKLSYNIFPKCSELIWFMITFFTLLSLFVLRLL